MKILLCILLISLPVSAEENPSELNFGMNAGFIYGGPMPTNFLENLEFSPLFGPFLGISYDYRFSEKFSVQAQIALSMKGATYNTFFSRDTIVETEIDGKPGLVPTFYTAMIDGDMGLFYIDIPIFLKYKLSKKIDLLAGSQASILIAGKNDVNARVIVGEGGFYDDIKKYFDNFDFLNSLDFAFCLGASYNLSERFKISAYGTRSITPLYKDSFKTEKEIDAGKMYHTNFVMVLEYNF